MLFQMVQPGSLYIGGARPFSTIRKQTVTSDNKNKRGAGPPGAQLMSKHGDERESCRSQGAAPVSRPAPDVICFPSGCERKVLPSEGFVFVAGRPEQARGFCRFARKETVLMCKLCLNVFCLVFFCTTYFNFQYCYNYVTTIYLETTELS